MEKDKVIYNPGSFSTRKSWRRGLIRKFLVFHVGVCGGAPKEPVASKRECGTRGPEPWLLRYQISPGGRYEG